MRFKLNEDLNEIELLIGADERLAFFIGTELVKYEFHIAFNDSIIEDNPQIFIAAFNNYVENKIKLDSKERQILYKLVCEAFPEYKKYFNVLYLKNMNLKIDPLPNAEKIKYLRLIREEIKTYNSSAIANLLVFCIAVINYSNETGATKKVSSKKSWNSTRDFSMF